MIKTVLGNISESEIGITLSHEHICCYSEYLYTMAGKDYLDKDSLLEASVKYLKELKLKYDLKTFVDCTPINIGRDIELLKKVSKKSGVNIVCSTGFYYTEEPLFYNLDIDAISEYLILDAKKVNAGIIKCAVENEVISDFDEKLLKASAKANLKLNIPIVVHTNANNKNGIKALEILLQAGVKPQAITIGHLSDTDDLEYIKQIAKSGCFIGFDRLYDDFSDEYIKKEVNKIIELCDFGYADKIILSHDALVFNGFDVPLELNDKPRFSYLFEFILPRLPNELFDKLIKENPLRMLKYGGWNAV